MAAYMSNKVFEEGEGYIRSISLQDGKNGTIYKVALRFPIVKKIESGDVELAEKILQNVKEANFQAAASSTMPSTSRPTGVCPPSTMPTI